MWPYHFLKKIRMLRSERLPESVKKIFYFDTERTEIQTPAEYLGTMDKETLALLIEEAISELKNELPDYYQYFESALSV